MSKNFARVLLASVLFAACGLAPITGYAQTVTPKAIRSTKTDPALGVGVTSNSASAKESKPTGPARFESEIAAFEKWDHQNAVPRDCILFVGSSTIRLWQTADAFPDLPVINRGFGGSTVADVNYFADRIVFKYKPRTIVFYAGDNDIAGGRSPERVFGDFEKFAD